MIATRSAKLGDFALLYLTNFPKDIWGQGFLLCRFGREAKALFLRGSIYQRRWQRGFHGKPQIMPPDAHLQETNIIN